GPPPAAAPPPPARARHPPGHPPRRTRDATLRLTAWHCGVTKPVVAAVNGTVAGGGLHFVADADIVLAASDATFLDPHVSVGQVTAYETIGPLDRAAFEPVMHMAPPRPREAVAAARARRRRARRR